jgi:hypothetical protein
MLKIGFDDTDMKKRMYPLKICYAIELDGISYEVSPINLKVKSKFWIFFQHYEHG